jgi:Na+-transporting methylmalonyl-CoA/oxaloacetate decarboxylase gamma subunit
MVKHSVLRSLILLHRCFGVVFCLLFAMWFASGVVMHFVPFPAASESERIAALLPIDLPRINRTPAQAVAVSKMAGAVRVRLIQRADGPVYIVSNPQTAKALRASDLADGAVRSAEAAIAIAAPGAGPSPPNIMKTPLAVETSADQWTVSEQYDSHRPLYRVALNDPAGTERYVSATTGEIVLTTTRHQRLWNYFGSVAHWIYPTALRSHPHLWNALLWWLALCASLGASLGAIVGIWRIGFTGSRLVSPYRGWHALHHWLGLICMPFVLTWIVSGWLSMDNGWLFSTAETASSQTIIGQPDWRQLPADELQRLSSAAEEVEWFSLGGHFYRRERFGAESQKLSVAGAERASERAFLQPAEVDLALQHVGTPCDRSFAIQPGDEYAANGSMAHAPVFRIVCGSDWFHIDGANGRVIEHLNESRRVYRWLYNGLHTLNFPILAMHPALRSALIVILCGCGFVFSVVGIVIAQMRLQSLW